MLEYEAIRLASCEPFGQADRFEQIVLGWLADPLEVRSENTLGYDLRVIARQSGPHDKQIFKLDRFARNERDAFNNDYILEEAGCELVSYAEPMLDRSNAGRMMFTMLSGNNAYQSRNSGDEIKRKTLIKIQEGGTHGCAPLGYKNVGEGGRRWVEPDPEPFELLRWSFYAYATGEYSVESLTAEATERGLLSKGGPNTPRVPLSPSTMHRRLESPYYKGIVVLKGVEYQGKHEPLVDEQTWQRVQELLSSKRQGLKQRTHHHYLKGTIWCGHCGSARRRCPLGRSYGRSVRYRQDFEGRTKCAHRRPLAETIAAPLRSDRSGQSR